MPLNVMIADLTSGLAAPSRAIGDSRSRLACKANSLVSGSTLLVGLRPGVRYRSPQSDQPAGER